MNTEQVTWAGGVSIVNPQAVTLITDAGVPGKRSSRVFDTIWNLCLALVIVLLVIAVCVLSALTAPHALGGLVGYVAGSLAVLAFLAYKR